MTESRRRWLAAAAAVVLMVRQAAPAAEPAYDVYVLTGQSNMLGTTGSSDPKPAPGGSPADERIAFFWSNATSTNAAYPATLYGDGGDALGPLTVQQGDGAANETFWGPEFGFARTLAGRGRKNVLLIKACRGGGSNSLWDEPTFERDPDAGHMWGHLRDTVRRGLDAATRDGRGVRLRGLLYLQGESNTAADAARAGERLASLAENLRREVEAKHPGSTAGMRTVVAEIAAGKAKPARVATVAAHRRLAEQDRAVTFIPTADLPLKADGIHFGGDAKLEIGRRMAEAVLGHAR